jgi:HAD superfamily hydrolase (TIGR01490 family)
MSKIVFFDLDGTIIDGDSEWHFFVYLLKQKKIHFKQVFLGSYFLLRWFLKYRLHVFVKNKSYLAGLEKSDIHRMAALFVKENIIQKIRPKIKNIIDEHLKNKDRLILITGTHEFLGKLVAQHLGIEEVYGTECVYQDGRFTKWPPKLHPFAKTKLKIAETVCEKYHEDIKNTVAYGNSRNDFYILNGVGRAVAVTPDKKLRKIAEQKHWEIID